MKRSLYLGLFLVIFLVLVSTYEFRQTDVNAETVSVISHNGAAAEPMARSESERDALFYARSLSTVFESIADHVTPSVVNIVASRRVQAQRPSARQRQQIPDQFRDFFGDDMFDRLFPQAPGRPGAPQRSPGGPEGFSQQGIGTGVIISTDGYILTNNHVIGDADDINVRLHDGRSLKASLIGQDPRTDIAVIKIETSEPLRSARLGNSDNLRIGEWVVAAGNPFGLDNTITAGIVSAKGRSIMGGNQFEDFIQTDAAINPGNSGGPLVNLEGEVVGINTAIFSNSGGYMGIGFAIPINMARHVLESLISEGRVIRGWLGVGIQDLTEEMAKSFGHPSTEGALVGHIQDGSPAQDAGIQQGDIIIQLNNESILNVNQLRHSVAALKPKETAKIKVVRDGKEKVINVRIGELSSEELQEAVPEEETTESLGVSVETLTPELAAELGSKQEKGVVVTSIQQGSVASSGGIQRGDIILQVGATRVNNAKEFRDAVAEVDVANGVRLLVETQGMERFVFIRVVE